MESQANFSSFSLSNTFNQPIKFLGSVEKNKAERLPFSIRFAKNEEDILKAVSVRYSAYARHVPDLAERLMEPESSDFEDGVLVLLAESKLDGRPLGTMRLQTNQMRSLQLESSVELPSRFKGCVLAEASRLGVTQERVGRVVKTLLFKAFYMHCLNVGIDWMVITARSPLDRHYESLLFEDIYPDRGYIPMSHVGDIPHRVFAHEIATAGQRWAEVAHPLYDLYFHTHHPDINIGQKTKLPAFLQDLENMRKVNREPVALYS
ncbi:MAG: hypothetical protein WAO76_05165 [Georgfuchsia sp.]